MGWSMQSKKIIIDSDLPIRMRDDTVLRADIYRPEDDNCHPAILCRLPYNKEDPLMHLEPSYLSGRWRQDL